MRVRTALVNPSKASGVNSIFKLAVERHLAWVVGVGRVYADTEKVAKAHGYRFWVPETNEDESPEFWLAVREDLIDDATVEEGLELIGFETTRKGLGLIGIGKNTDEELDNQPPLVFYVDGQEGPASSDEGRVKDISPNLVPADQGDFRYTEVLYSVAPLKS